MPLTVRVFHADLGMVASRFLDMCLCSLGTAAAYYDKVQEVFSIPWCNCVALSVDSTSVNVGRLKTRLEQRNPALFTLGCPCHFLHNAAHKGAKQLDSASGFDVEEMAVDVFCYFDHSIKRRGELREFT